MAVVVQWDSKHGDPLSEGIDLTITVWADWSSAVQPDLWILYMT
jgi:hypothetical protein